MPVGILSLIGIYRYVPDNETHREGFDIRGFALLALALAVLQIMLDRGEQVDWFEALEIQFYAIAIVLALYLYIVHTLTCERRFFSPELLRDRNFVSATPFIFVVGIILLSTMALLPPFLQQWKEYPVLTTGLIVMPRGVGTLMKYMDPRLLIFIGLGLVGLSLHHMAGFNL